jgi:hypothetical protein
MGKLCLAAAVACASLATAAQAAITSTWIRSDPTPAAIAQDPALATMQSYLLRITHTNGDWSSAGVQVTLTGGNYYNHALGGNTLPNPALVGLFAGLAYDTYVSSPTDNGTNNVTNVLGGFPSGPASLSGNVFSVAWGDLVSSPAGTYDIARLTFPANLTTVAQVNVLTEDDPGNEQSFTSQVNPDGFVLIGEIIPEPSALSLVALTGVFAMRRRS